MIAEGATREELEALYRSLMSTLVILARMLGKPCPVVTRDERRMERRLDMQGKP